MIPLPEATVHIPSEEAGSASAHSAAPRHIATGETHTITAATRRARLRDIFKTMPVAGVLALRDFKAQYAQSILGPIWLLAQPLGMLAAFTVVFNGVTKSDTSGVPYTLFALVGITVWTFTSAMIAGAPRIFLKARTLIMLINSPKSVFINSSLLISLPNLVIPLILTLVGIFTLGWHYQANLLFLPLCIIWLVAFLYFAALVFAALNVWARDVSSILPFFMQGGVFLTPVGYSLTDAPPKLVTLLSLNPLTGIIETWRWSLLGSTLDTKLLLISGIWTVVLIPLSWRVFTRLETRFADVI